MVGVSEFLGIYRESICSPGRHRENRYGIRGEPFQPCAQESGAALALDIFGGELVIGEDGRITLIDLNDWPSFAPAATRPRARSRATSSSDPRCLRGFFAGWLGDAVRICLIQRGDRLLDGHDRSLATASGTSAADCTYADADDGSSPVPSRSSHTRPSASSRAGAMSWYQLQAT
jgi:hypothetical protein